MWRVLSRYAVNTIREKAGHLACNSPFYNWSLGGGVSESFVMIPPDYWPGDAEAGRNLCTQELYFNDEEVAPHSFTFLRDLRALGGEQARCYARDMVDVWIGQNHSWKAFGWRSDILGQRLSSWISFYEFFGASADDDFQEQFFDSVTRQARHLSRALSGGASGMEGLVLLRAIRGLAYAGMACEGQQGWLAQALDLLEQEAGKQILSDGCHISRSPAQLLEALQIFIDIRNGLLCGTYPVSSALTQTIDRMAQGLRFFRYPDKGFGLFNGTQEGDRALIDAVLARANAKGRVLSNLPHGGYERLTVGRSLLMVDSGTTPPWPYDGQAHAAPLGFEFAYGKERIFVNCGTHPSDPAWQDALRGTGAHSALSIDHRNACEISADGHFIRKPRKIVVTREETQGATLLEGAHDGYVPLNGVTHRRRFLLGAQGHDLRGEEILTCSVGLSKPIDIALRFHLHPGVKVSLIREGQEALLQLSGGAGWRFFYTGGDLTLENSVYLGHGARPRKTKQLVISGTMHGDYAQIKWALQREGV